MWEFFMLFTQSRKKIKYFSSPNLFYTRTSVVIIDNVHLAADEASTPDESSNLSKFRISAVLLAIRAPVQFCTTWIYTYCCGHSHPRSLLPGILVRCQWCDYSSYH